MVPLEKVKPPVVPDGAVLLLLPAEPKAKPAGAAAWLEGVLVAAGAPKEKPPVIPAAGVAVLAPKFTLGVFALGKKRKEANLLEKHIHSSTQLVLSLTVC